MATENTATDWAKAESYASKGIDFDPVSADARLATDFLHVAGQNFRPERGLYQNSNYRVRRYDDTHSFAGNMYLKVPEHQLQLTLKYSIMLFLVQQ